eukprot:COSAG02_NODE_63126_length_264_cov_0.618182_1_plen_36_part_01
MPRCVEAGHCCSKTRAALDILGFLTCGMVVVHVVQV